MILGLGIPEILLILGIALLIFGPKNLPKLGSALGKTVKNVREGMDGAAEEAKAETEKAPEQLAEDVEVEAAAKFCSKCGAKNDEGAEFCSKCGNKLSA